MKLTDKAKKRLALAGFGVVCVVLIIAIASQFKAEAPKEANVQPSATVTDNINPSSITPAAAKAQSSTPEVSVLPITPTEPASKVTADTGDSQGTEQKIQAEVTKPSEPSKEAKTDPAKKPDGEKVTAVTPVEHDKVTKPESKSSSATSTPKSGDKKDGKIYVPGFGWIDDNGGGVEQKTVGGEGDINKQVGEMN